MNILYINHYAGSMSMGMEFRPYYFAREWQKLGHKVRVIGASFSHLRVQNPKVIRDYEIQTVDGVEFQWIKTGRYKGNGLSRALTIFTFCGKLSAYAPVLAKEFHPDVVISSSTYPLDTYACQRIARCSGCRYIHEAHDLWPLTLIELAGWNERHPFIRLLAAAERSALSNADHVVAVTAHERDYMLEHGLENADRFTHIPNGVATEDWDSPEPLPAEHARTIASLKEQGKFIVCYLGGHALSNALDTFLDAAKQMKNDGRVSFVMVGNGTEKARLQERARREEIGNLIFMPPIRKKQVPSLLKEVDALYVGAAPCRLYRYGVSMNKVYDYMMASKPILYGVEAANNDVEEAGCGITIPPGDASALAAAARELMAMNEESRRKMGERGKAWVTENCDYAKLSQRFLACFESSAGK